MHHPGCSFQCLEQEVIPDAFRNLLDCLCPAIMKEDLRVGLLVKLWSNSEDSSVRLMVELHDPKVLSNLNDSMILPKKR